MTKIWLKSPLKVTNHEGKTLALGVDVVVPLTQRELLVQLKATGAVTVTIRGVRVSILRESILAFGDQAHINSLFEREFSVPLSEPKMDAVLEEALTPRLSPSAEKALKEAEKKEQVAVKASQPKDESDF